MGNSFLFLERIISTIQLPRIDCLNDFLIGFIRIFQLNISGVFYEENTAISTSFIGQSKSFGCLFIDAVSMNGNGTSLIICVFTLIALVLFAFVIYLWTSIIRQNKIMAMLEDERITTRINHEDEIGQYRDREIGFRIVELERRNKLVEKMKVKLTRVKEKLPEKNWTLINNLIKDIDTLSEGDLWNEFEGIFNEAHPTFIRDLSRRYPDLTANELKICALIRINITSKDISDIADLSIKSIEAMRTRLRKKFDLSATDIYLGDFLKQF